MRDFKLSFPSQKLKGKLKKINTRFVEIASTLSKTPIVYGVTNNRGVVITGKEVSANLNSYIYVTGEAFIYNPYRINIGSIGLTNKDFEGLVSPAYEVFKVNDEIIPEFLLIYIKSTLGKNLIKWYGDRGGVRNALRFKDFENIDFPVIEKDVQEKILSKLQKTQREIQLFDESLNLKLLKDLKTSIIQSAIQGKLIPQDPLDESVKILFEKIQAGRAKLINEGKIKNEKPLPEIKPEETPFVIPQSWKWVRLGEISTATQGIQLLKENQIDVLREGYIRYLYISDFSNESNLKYVKDIYKDKIVTTKDLVMANTGATAGKVMRGVFGVLSNNLFKISLDEQIIHLDYLHYFLKSSHFFNQTQLKGGANPHLGHQKYYNVTFPLPPLAEQKRIVEKIDELMSFVNQLEQKLKYSKELASKLNEAVLNETLES